MPGRHRPLDYLDTPRNLRIRHEGGFLGRDFSNEGRARTYPDYKGIPSREQICVTSSKMEPGTMNGSVAATSAKWASIASAVGGVSG